MLWWGIAVSSTLRSRNGETMLSAELKTISESTVPSRRR